MSNIKNKDTKKSINNCEVSVELENYSKDQIAISEGKEPETIEIYEKIYRNANLSFETQYQTLFGKPFNDDDLT